MTIQNLGESGVLAAEKIGAILIEEGRGTESVKAGLARDPKTLPRIERDRPLSNGASATVELLKVLLRMTSEQHGVAAKVIANSDDLDKIASEGEEATVAALTGWRRDLFGDVALKLINGEVALRFAGKKVEAVEVAASEP